MNYKIKLNKAETHGVYVLERLLKKALRHLDMLGAGSAQGDIGKNDLSAAELVVKRLMEAVEEGMVVKFVTSAPLSDRASDGTPPAPLNHQ